MASAPMHRTAGDRLTRLGMAGATEQASGRRSERTSGSRPLSQPQPASAKFAFDPEGLSPGNVVDLLVNGEDAFPAMLEAIDHARRYVHLETYILADDESGRKFARALSDAARRGVEVRLMFDSVGSVSLPSAFTHRLVASGVEVVEFRPLRRYILSKLLTNRDHRKILVVDGHTGFTGGLNLSNDYITTRDSPGWRDTHARVRGPAVSELASTFERTWSASGGASFAVETEGHASAAAVEGSGMWAGVLVSDGKHHPAIRTQYLHAIRHARSQIMIANAYFVPDRQLVAELNHAVARGVAVDVIVPKRSDVGVVQLACEYLFDRLLHAGIRVHYWKQTHMHAKTAVIDGVWSVVGSYNLDAISLFRNKEVILQVVDEGFAARMVRQFEIDRASCEPLDASRWARRSWRRRFLEWACYRFRDWL